MFVPYHVVSCQKLHGGKRPLWNAKAPNVPATGAGNTADNAIRDLQRQARRMAPAESNGAMTSAYLAEFDAITQRCKEAFQEASAAALVRKREALKS